MFGESFEFCKPDEASTVALFKTKVHARAFVASKWNYLFASERERVWDQMRSALGDSALQAVSSDVFYVNMRAVMLQLQGVSVAKNHRLDAVTSYSLAVADRIKAHPSIEMLKTQYNQAFGSPVPDGMIPMLRMFDHLVANGQLQEGTLKRLYDEFYGVLGTMFDEFKSIKLIP